MLDSEFSGEQQGAFQETGRRYKKARIKPLTAGQREILQEQQQLYLLERMDLEREILEDQELIKDLRWQRHFLASRYAEAAADQGQKHWEEEQVYRQQDRELEKIIREFRDGIVTRHLEIQELARPAPRGADYVHDDCRLQTGILQGKKVQESRDGREAPDADSYYCLFCEKGYGEK